MIAALLVATAADFAQRVDAIAQKTLARPVAGISIAVARNGTIEFARGYGSANLEHSVPVTPETRFHICSISKNILAAVLVQLGEQGKLDLDDDVTKYVQEAPTHGKRVTVRQLLNHTSGMYSFTSLPDAADNEPRDLDHAQVLALFRDKPFVFEPGTSWRYDNSAFYIAGMVVERVTKQDYGTYVRDRLFQPLGMTSAGLCYARAIVPHLASGYEVEGGKLVNAAPISWKLPFAAGAVCMTASDLVKWQEAVDDGRVISKAALQMMRTPTTLSDGTPIDYGLGTRIGSLDGHRVFGHTGSGGGFNAILEDFPDDHLIVVVLTNSGAAFPTAAAVARAALASSPPRPVDLPLTSEEAAALPGTFDSDEGPIEQFVRDGRLRFRIPGQPGDYPLLRQADGSFVADDTTVVRYRIRDGKAVWGFAYEAGLMLDAKPRSSQ